MTSFTEEVFITDYRAHAETQHTLFTLCTSQTHRSCYWEYRSSVLKRRTAQGPRQWDRPPRPTARHVHRRHRTHPHTYTSPQRTESGVLPLQASNGLCNRGLRKESVGMGSDVGKRTHTRAHPTLLHTQYLALIHRLHARYATPPIQMRVFYAHPGPKSPRAQEGRKVDTRRIRKRIRRWV